ncbi:MAG: hypothetical protein ACJ78Q_11585, partial [Chloroflexia bacterium]
MAQIYKQINACVGQLGLESLEISTTALNSGSPSDDHVYQDLENFLMGVTAQRNSIAGQMNG